jgi:tartrate-resistant acid phosphatase type 5
MKKKDSLFFLPRRSLAKAGWAGLALLPVLRCESTQINDDSQINFRTNQKPAEPNQKMKTTVDLSFEGTAVRRLTRPTFVVFVPFARHIRNSCNSCQHSQPVINALQAVSSGFKRLQDPRRAIFNEPIFLQYPCGKPRKNNACLSMRSTHKMKINLPDIFHLRHGQKFGEMLSMKQTRREFVRTLFIASEAAVASRFLPVNLLAESLSPDALNFVVIGDWGRRGEPDQQDVATQMGKTAHNLGARFVISVGDNFYEDGVASVQDTQWQESFEDVYTAQSLQVPWYSILGNHDYHWNCDAQIAYSKKNSRWRMPARYYAQSHPVDKDITADFFYIDTTPMVGIYYNPFFEESTRNQVITQNVPAQLAWLKAALAASKAQWKIVIGHHPIYSGGEHGDTHELIEHILPLLQEYGVQAYFNGHDHDLQHLMAGDINLFISGGGSQMRPTGKTKRTKFAKSSSGFTAVSLGPQAMDVRMIDSKGTLLYTARIFRNGVTPVPAPVGVTHAG